MTPVMNGAGPGRKMDTRKRKFKVSLSSGFGKSKKRPGSKNVNGKGGDFA